MRLVRFTALTAILLLTAAANGQRSFELDILAETFRYGEEAEISLHDDGSVTMLRGDQTLSPTRLYWFSWYTFHPGTDLIH
jgi:hypothetical protein